MEIRISNNGGLPLRVVLEPWATEYLVAPGDHLRFRSATPIPENAHFLVEHSEDFVVVFPEWSGALVHAYASNGTLID